jgi:hypothetical protein
MTIGLRYHSILAVCVFSLFACADLPDFPTADRLAGPAGEPAEAALAPGPTTGRLRQDAALAGLQAGGNVTGSVAALMLSGARW